MADLTLNVEEVVGAFAKTPVITKLAPAEVPVLSEMSPCHWNVRVQEDGSIIATSRLGERFVGSIDYFNELLRG